MEEHVILVDENNEPIGTRSKTEVHGAETDLHRGFSVFVFDHEGNFLIQQRAGSKQTWPLVWSNSCCGHPRVNESGVEPAQRRLAEELGMTDVEVHEVLPDYRYRAIFNGVMENEFCPVFAAWISDAATQLKLNSDEVEAVRWILWDDFIREVTSGNPQHAYHEFSVWSLEEAVLLNHSETFQELWNQNVQGDSSV